MKRIKKAIFIIFGVLAAVVLGLTALIYIPSPKFEPVAYEPIAPDYWPTDGFLTSTPEEQGMDSAKVIEMLDYYEEQHAQDSEFSLDSIFGHGTTSIPKRSGSKIQLIDNPLALLFERIVCTELFAQIVDDKKHDGIDTFNNSIVSRGSEP